MTTRFSITDDLQSGYVYAADDGDESILCDGGSITIYGCRYEIGLDYGDGQGAPLKRIGLADYPHHNTIGDLHSWDGDCTQPDCDLPPLYTTAGEYGRLCPDFDRDAIDADADQPITVFADNTFCFGHYDGKQTTESLV